MSQTILITGSSTGIGRSSAKYFQAKGWNVIATMRSPQNEKELNQLENVIVTKLDVLDQDSIDNSIKAGIDKFGSIDVVLNNAGYAVMGTFESAPKESIRRQFGVNVFGLIDVTQAILPHFRANKNGLIINVSSIGGKMTFPLMPLYHATKFAVEGFSESLAYELEPLGIKVKIVEPGGVVTDFATRSLDFAHNEALTEYNGFVGQMMNTYETAFSPETSSTPELIAEVIYTAAIDESNQLRYRAGADAEQLLSARASMDDKSFTAMMKQNLKMN